MVPGRGVKVNQIYYWSDRFRNPAVEGTRVAVRYDPFDVGVAYAFVERQWVRCCSEYHAVFQGRSEKEILLASSELRRRHRTSGAGWAATARALAGFLESVESEEVLLAQRMRDREAQATRGPQLAVAPIRSESDEPQAPAWTAAPPIACELYGEF